MIQIYVTKDTDASDANGGYPLGAGGSSAPAFTSAAVTTAVDDATTLVCAGGWGSVAAGDLLIWDPATNKERRKVSAVNGTLLTVSPGLDNPSPVTPMTVNVGGALTTLAAAEAAVNVLAAVHSEPLAVNVKYNASAYAETLTLLKLGTSAANHIVYDGYEAAAGDGCPSGNRPKIDATSKTYGITCAALTGNAYRVFKNLEVYSAGTTCVDLLGVGYVGMVNCVVHGSGGTYNISVGSASYLVNCTWYASAYLGAVMLSSGTVVGCTAYDNAGIALDMYGSGLIYKSAFRSKSGVASSHPIRNPSTGIVWCVGCTCDCNANTTTYAFYSSNSGGAVIVVDSIALDFSTAVKLAASVGLVRPMVHVGTYGGGTLYENCEVLIAGPTTDPKFSAPNSTPPSYALLMDSPARRYGAGGADLGALQTLIAAGAAIRGIKR